MITSSLSFSTTTTTIATTTNTTTTTTTANTAASLQESPSSSHQSSGVRGSRREKSFVERTNKSPDLRIAIMEICVGQWSAL
ncbi:hypothetical protein E2C01_022696 [Portunus trituberculatus]|uniref:Uncharacterized protein n=1 Tax=Portunus trituberculatus TaxID=210409 RepID=A0A5B7E625_PORTR|nr:hypothetical protein [Portunus trituberculatus]